MISHSQTWRLMTFLLVIASFLFTACEKTIAVNWYLRIEKTETCDGYALMAGDALLLCSLEKVIWNGDSLVVKSLDRCYFIDLQAYRDGQELANLACEELDQFVQLGAHTWPP